jgi:Domain of Unknown Function (DUF1080)
MRTSTPVMAAVAFYLVWGAALGSSDGEEADRIAKLIRQLGDEKFAQREAATRDLMAIGEKCLPLLRKAARSSADQEIRLRAKTVLANIGQTDAKTVPPPKNAIFLFDGKNLDGWVARDGVTPAPWILLQGGVMEAREVDIRSRQTFTGPYQLHLEFRLPANPPETIYGRGNSGVYVHGRYEVQILDSYGPQPVGATHAKPVESCGAIFGQASPRVQACKAPGFWQNYDIEFFPPRFKDGKRVAQARMTVFHNGALIHDDVEIPVDDTGLALPGDPATPGAVMLQYHQSAIQFRNVWIVQLPQM